MKNRNEFDAFLMYARLMSGETNIVEHMETEGQKEAIYNTMLAKRMDPSKEEWEQLGFIFEEIPGDNMLFKAKLPEGWSIKSTNHPLWSEIFDENNSLRGSMFYKAVSYDRDAHMNLKTRYRICYVHSEEDKSFLEVYFGNEEEKLFVAGKVKSPTESDDYDTYYAKRDELTKIAMKYADENYPNWRSVQAYWKKNKKKHKLINKPTEEK